MAEARQCISIAIAQAKTRIRHLCLIDICADFERQTLQWIETAIGESRRVIGKHYDIKLLQDVRERLIKDPDHFGSFDSILKLVEGKVAAQDMVALQRLREQRNKSAHGEDLDGEPSVSIEEARQVLAKLLESLACA